MDYARIYREGSVFLEPDRKADLARSACFEAALAKDMPPQYRSALFAQMFDWHLAGNDRKGAAAVVQRVLAYIDSPKDPYESSASVQPRNSGSGSWRRRRAAGRPGPLGPGGPE
ncbi:MAG: hypothetical protein ACYTGO_21730 [Planctomycetota bacterium]